MNGQEVEEALLPDVIDNTPPPAPLTLFGNDPELAVQRMSGLAKVLMDVVRDRKLYARIRGEDYLINEAWVMLGSMLGIVPVVEWTRPLGDDDGWEARVVVKTLDGREVGAAESMCTRSESTWSKRDSFALRGMAQTRAVSRALRAPLGQIVALAGYQAAGAEEMPDEIEPRPSPPTTIQKQKMRGLLDQLTELAPEVNWPEQCRKAAGVPGSELTEADALVVIGRMLEWVNELESRTDDG